MKLSPKVWSTKAVEELLQQINRTGVVPRYNPFHKGDVELRDADLRWEYTEDESNEYAKIGSSIIYFALNYCQVMTDDGIIKIKHLRDYQKKNLIAFTKYKNCVWLASRQIGKSITVAIFIVWYILTNKDRNILLLSRNGDKVEELVQKIETIIRGLPFWLKPGTKFNNIMKKSFDNGIMMIAERTTENAGASVTAQLVYIDEFALVSPKFKTSFWRTVYPTMSSSEIAKMIITSTPRGLDKFHDIYMGGMESENTFHPMRTDWYEVPGRDEQWRLDQIADLGSEEDFNQEYGNQFLAGNQLLFHSSILKRLKKMEIEFIHHDIDIFDDLEIAYEGFLKWHPKFNLEDCKDDNAKYVFSIDLADGSGGNNCYSVINMFKVLPMTKEEIDNVKIFSEEKDLFKLVQIGVFRSNLVPLEDLAKVLYHLSVDIFEKENVKVVLETNHEGKYYVSKVSEVEGENNELEVDALFVHYPRTLDSTQMRLGLKNNEQLRDMNCKIIKDKVKYSQLILVNTRTVTEALSFAKDKNGKYRGEGFDDEIMTCINICSYYDTDDFREQVDDLMENSVSDKFKAYIEKKLNRKESRINTDEDDYADILI